MPNTELLKRTLHHIETNPQTWVQEEFTVETGCGTAHCFAGWALTLSGVDINDRHYVFPVDQLPAGVRERLGADFGEAGPDGSGYTDIAELATALLDIPAWAGDETHLFDGGNTLDDLRHIVAELCDENTEARA